MWYKMVLRLSVVLLVVSGTLFSQNVELLSDLTPHLGSTRSIAMAGTYTATDMGVDALFSNPGGLGFATGSQFSFGGRMILLGKSAYEEDYYEEVDFTSGFSFSPKITNLAVCVPIEFSENSPTTFFGAVGYRSFYDWNRAGNSEYKDEDYKSETTYTVNGLINQLTIGGGLLIQDKYSVGISLGIPMLSGYSDELESKTSSDFSSAKTTYETEFDVDGGSSFQIGAMAKLTPDLVVGFSYLKSHEFELEDGTEKIKSDGDVSEDELSDEKWEFPGMFSIGASYSLSPTARVTAEFQNRPWEDVEVDGDELGDFDIESGSALRFGFEGGTDLLYRAGYGFERTLILDADDDPVNMNMITGGIGFKSNDMLIDIAAVYRFTKYEDGRWDGSYDYIFNELKIYATLKYNFDFTFSLAK